MPKYYWSPATLYKMESLFSISNTHLFVMYVIVYMFKRCVTCSFRLFVIVSLFYIIYLMLHCMCLSIVNQILVFLKAYSLYVYKGKGN